jgi:putative intracellular protease/amidase
MRNKIAVMLESHYDPTEPGAFAMYFREKGYEVEYISNLRGDRVRTFKDNDGLGSITVEHDLGSVDLGEYAGLVLVGGYGMDMLRYEVFVEEGKPNIPRATAFVADGIARHQHLILGAVCHSLWLLTPMPELLKGKHVTCGHNIMHDVRNCGAILVYNKERRMLADTHVDGNLVTGRHPYVIQKFMDVFLDEVNKRAAA